MRPNRLLSPIALAAIALALMPAASAQADPTDAMVAEINTARRAHGLRPVRVSRVLTASSRAYARYLISRDVFGHAARIAGFRTAGEVLELHSGSRARIRGALRAWLRSPGHRAVLLSSRYRYVGVGRAVGRWRGMRATIWVGRLGA